MSERSMRHEEEPRPRSRFRLHASTWIITVPFALLGMVIALVGDYHWEACWTCEHGWPLRFAERVAYDELSDLSLWSWDGRVERFDPWALALDMAVVALSVVVLATLLEWRRRRRQSFWQVSLRDTLALMVIVGAVSAWIGSAYRNSMRQSGIVEKLQRLSPSVQVFWDVRSDWFFDLLGIAVDKRSVWWADVSFLSVGDPAADADELMKQVEQLSALQFLGVQNILMTDVACKRLSRLTELEVLIWGNSCMSDKHVRYLASLENLRILDLSHNHISDEGLAYLHGLKRLETLDIVNNQITDEGVEALQRAIPGLQVSDD